MPGPGKTLDAFQADNGACKAFAADAVKGQADAANQRAVGTALLTTALGAGLGAAGGSLGGDAGGGAALGAAAGAGAGTAFGAGNNSADQQGIQYQYDNAFSQCMYAKGEAVPGYAPVATAYVPSAGPAADPLVRSTQSELIRLGYLRGSADGFSGPKTRSAISAYEQANGLPVDGSASSRLLARLQGTPTHAAAAATASAPSAWVAPTSGAPSATPASASAPAAGGWVSPTK
ncbi:MAG TPA: peptidoglycan-binding domain-containing protein [Rhodopila sp.]|jgi:hypothetical protein